MTFAVLNKTITKKQFFIFSGLFFCLSILAVFKLIPGVIGFIVLLFNMIGQAEFIRLFSQKKNWTNNYLTAWIFLLTYYILSLSLIYYLFGITYLSLVVWLAINFLVPCLSFVKDDWQIEIKLPKKFFSDLTLIINKPAQIACLVICVYLISHFFAWPIINGSPSPWLEATIATFILFFIATFLILRDIIKKETNDLLCFLYCLVIIGVVAIKYVLSYGYDTLLHQAALQYIVDHGQIDPLTPFYVGQYVLEILIHYFTSWSFVWPERWFLPLFFIILMLAAGKYFLRVQKLPVSLAIVSASILFLLPAEFIYTSPYAFALLWAIIAILGSYLFLFNGQKHNFVLAVLAALIALLVHPFVGLSVLVAVISIYFYQKSKTRTKKVLVLVSTFIISSLVVILAFASYNWLRGDVIILAHPIYYIDNFLSLFSGPIWYHYESPPWWLWTVYFYEKIHFGILLLLAILSLGFFKKERWIIFFFLVVSLGALVSSWLFVSSLEVSGYSYGDQINYSYRLLQVSKWLLFPLVIMAIINIFSLIKKLHRFWWILIIFIFSVLLLASWYLTYPRQDHISRLNVNNVRKIDYQAIDWLYQREKGKQGYIVLANQIFGAAAVQRYGFRPYYPTRWGEIFYYSIPMSGELNRRFEKIMDNNYFDRQIIDDIKREAGVERVYLITTDYWPLKSEAQEQVALMASNFWQIDKQIYIYLFE